MKYLKKFESLSNPAWRRVSYEEWLNFSDNIYKAQAIDNEQLKQIHYLGGFFFNQLKDKFNLHEIKKRYYCINKHLYRSWYDNLSQDPDTKVLGVSFLGLINNDAHISLYIKKHEDDWWSISYTYWAGGYFICDEFTGVESVVQHFLDSI